MTAPALFDLTGRLALVTGSSGGIGLAIAAGLADAGARVILNGRDAARLDEAAARLRDATPPDGTRTILTRAFDVTDRAAVEQAIGAIEAEDGPIRILVNNAGIQRRAPLDVFPPEDWAEIIRTNLDSVFFVGTAVARHMIPRGAGKIINIGSVQCELARPGIAPYTATKGAVKNLTRGMCADWARHGLQVNAIGPGYFETPLNRALVADPDFNAWLTRRTPAGRWGKVEELQGAAIFLASDASSFVNGQTLYVDGGVLSVL
ncbi:SDR family oxidoreductase [Gluconacetobacter sacchari]|uniref:SDR family oxidoreductase n=2 Tax=Gluconacetobacter sacchari TaxID=92759 RepID=A0A7W4NTD9_9PROT|nr:SDR family oxidoreductase [Gluconacetobacter sacchari]MBB2162195.1 SDR family oxidoreductase [Gluconacetobacter sacchari]GBQ24058.1 gluconate 5-dehydrogenase [Gluconacetobacter sacchari DSM 12717]